MSISNSELREQKKIKKTKYLQKYKKEWEQLPEFEGWLQKSEISVQYATCKCCNKNINITSGKEALIKHNSSNGHKEKYDTLSNQSLITSFIAQPQPGTSARSLENEVDEENCVVQLINEVEQRPALYKKSLKEYSDSNMRKKLWEEVCEAVFADWNELSVADKTKKGREVQKKWSNLRTCFRRELTIQKNTKSRQAATKRRKYMYFEQLLFLLPYMENRNTEGNLEEEDNNFQENDEDDDQAGPSNSTTPIRKQKRLNASKTTNVDDALVKALNESNGPDEDVNFALSLVPSLQNLTPDEKLDAKIGILSVFKEIRLARCGQSSQPIFMYNEVQQPLSSVPNHRGTNNMPPQQHFQTSTFRSTPSSNSLPKIKGIRNNPSPGNSSDVSQSYYPNEYPSDESQIGVANFLKVSRSCLDHVMKSRQDQDKK
ncbi:uncharacterized protein LOC126892716 [Diabrotica virgifera virgifera]|uniref:Uncharacterized protein LOC114341679 n=1 Tax=Diabrotica virgifera virgifera TaxID=50390 RepID=A0A6P7GSL6_DIAVI|nr:uncharacterized protein LOC126892716 [Diabrotica virgifera virgifera]